MGHTVLAATDSDPDKTLLCTDGVGACDHVFRSARMSKLLEVRRVLPFVRSLYARPSQNVWIGEQVIP